MPRKCMLFAAYRALSLAYVQMDVNQNGLFDLKSGQKSASRCIFLSFKCGGKHLFHRELRLKARERHAVLAGGEFAVGLGQVERDVDGG